MFNNNKKAIAAVVTVSLTLLAASGAAFAQRTGGTQAKAAPKPRYTKARIAIRS